LALDRALLRILYPLMVRELKAKLLDEAKQSIIRVYISLAIFYSVRRCLSVCVMHLLICTHEGRVVFITGTYRAAANYQACMLVLLTTSVAPAGMLR